MENYFINLVENNEESNFFGSDSKKLFKKNLNAYGNKPWIYKYKHITYKRNAQGFRTRSFESLDWSNSIVVFGCSNVEGIGLAEEDTLCFQIEKIIGIPVVNLGIGGSAVDLACWNSMQLCKYYPKPKAIVHVWTSLNRYTNHDDGKFTGVLPQYKNFSYRLDWSYRSKMYIETDRILWKDKLPYVEASFFKHDYQCQSDILPLNYFDSARDLMHPGIESNRYAAKMIAEQLIKQKI